MKVYRHTFHDKKTGKKKTCKNWYISFTDNRQIRRQLPAFPSKKAAERAAAKIEELLSCQGILNRDLQAWLLEIPEPMRKRLVKYGIVSGARASRNLGKNLFEHLEDYRTNLQGKRKAENYIKQTCRQVEVILQECGFRLFTDIDAVEVLRFCKGFSEGTSNLYVSSIKSFVKWLIADKRTTSTDNPLATVKLVKQTEFVKERRALTKAEKIRFLEATEVAPKRFHMGGYERCLVYRLSLEAGLRAGEVKSLRKLSFDFENHTVKVLATDCKSKRTDILELNPETSDMIRKHVEGKQPTDVAFNTPHLTSFSEMVRKDLSSAGISYTDAADRDVDFHALRHTFCTHLADNGVPIHVIQESARHKSIEVTQRYCKHVLYKSKIAAISTLVNRANLTDTYPNQALSIDVGRQSRTKKVG